MWLPKDERRLLTGYYHAIGTIDHDAVYHLSSLGPALNTYRPCKLHQCGDEPESPIPEGRDRINEFLNAHVDVITRSRCANERLAARGLIQITNQADSSNVIVVSLTVAGYDLGRRYASGWDRTGLCFAEYKDHWITLVVSILAAVVTSLIIHLLTKP